MFLPGTWDNGVCIIDKLTADNKQYYCYRRRPVSAPHVCYLLKIFLAQIYHYWPSENTSRARIGERFRSSTQSLEAYRGVFSDQAKIDLIFAI